MSDAHDSSRFAVSDALLPLLDISVLLLGLFMIIMAMGQAASSQAGSSGQPTVASLPIEVSLLKINADGQVEYGGRSMNASDFSDELRSSREGGTEKLILLDVVDPWSANADSAYMMVLRAVRENHRRYCLVSN